nr:glycosyltransferase family 4 protein [Ferrimicrobium acidiphilum]
MKGDLINDEVIVFDSGHFPDPIGGGDTFIVEIVRRLPHFGWDPVFVTTSEGALAHANLGYSGRTLLWKATAFRGTSPELFGITRLVEALLRIPGSVVSRPRQVLVAASDYLYDSLPAVIFGSLRREAVLLVLHMIVPFPTSGQVQKPHLPHVTELMEWISNRLTILLGKVTGARFVVVHPQIRSRLESMFKIQDKMISVVSNGVSLISDGNTHTCVSDALYVGRFHPQKCLDDLLVAWRQVITEVPSAVLSIAGPGTSRLLPRVRELGLESSVHVFDAVSEPLKKELFLGTKVFLLPSHFESFPISLLEALSYGVPAIAYDLPCLTGPFDSGVIKVKRFDVPEYASQVVRLLKSDTLRRAMSAEALCSASNLTWDHSAPTFADALRGIR